MAIAWYNPSDTETNLAADLAKVVRKYQYWQKWLTATMRRLPHNGNLPVWLWMVFVVLSLASGWRITGTLKRLMPDMHVAVLMVAGSLLAVMALLELPYVVLLLAVIRLSRLNQQLEQFPNSSWVAEDATAWTALTEQLSVGLQTRYSAETGQVRRITANRAVPPDGRPDRGWP